MKTKKIKKSKKSKSKKTSEYKRGSLSKAIYDLFAKKGVDKVSYDETEKLAKQVMPKTKFNKYHYSWYKNKFRENQNK